MLKILFFIALIFSSYFSKAQGSAYDRTTILTYYQNMDFENGLNWLKNQPINDYNKAYLMDVGYCYYMLEMPIEARDTYKKIYEQEPMDFRANLYLAAIYDKLMYKKDDSAVVHYKKLVIIQPEQFKFWYLAGLCLNRVEEHDSAFHYLQKAYELKPSSGSIVVAYATALQRKNKGNSEAENVIDEFLKKDSSNVSVLNKKISIRYKEKDYKMVIVWGEKLLKDSVQPLSAPTSYIHLTYSYLNTNKIEESLNLCNWMNESNLSSEAVTYCQALCYSRQQHYVKSNELLNECINLNIRKEAQIYFRAKADNYAAMKHYTKAAREMDTSYYIFQDPVDLYLAGKIYDDQNNKAKAAVYYKKYLSENKKPVSPLEVKLENYMKEYLKPK